MYLLPEESLSEEEEFELDDWDSSLSSFCSTASCLALITTASMLALMFSSLGAISTAAKDTQTHTYYNEMLCNDSEVTCLIYYT